MEEIEPKILRSSINYTRASMLNKLLHSDHQGSNLIVSQLETGRI